MDVAADRPSASVAELVAAAVILPALALMQVAAAGCLDLFSHPLWLDETFTWLLVNDKSFEHMLASVAGGVDTNPPTLYLLLWPVARLLGPIDNVGLRAISMGSALAGILGLYAICRRCFERGPSAVAALAVWAHPIVVDQAFEARYYAPWLALTVWFCYLRMLSDGKAEGGERGGAVRRALCYVLAVLATCIHYFGAIAMTMIGMADLAVHRRIQRILPILVGLVAMAACAPLLFWQRAGLSVPTWIERASAPEIKDDLVAVFGAPPLLMVLLLAWADRLLRVPPSMAEARAGQRSYLDLIPFSSLLLFPAAILVFSVLVQPALVLRYLILAVAPLGPLLAWLMHRSGKATIVLALVGAIAMGAVAIVGKSRSTRGLDRDFRAILEQIDRRVPPDGLLVFKRRREMYPILRLRPDLLQRSAQLDFGDAAAKELSRMSRYERDMGRKVQRQYPEYRMVGLEELRRIGRFHVIAPVDEYRELQLELADFCIGDPQGPLHEVTLRR